MDPYAQHYRPVNRYAVRVHRAFNRWMLFELSGLALFFLYYVSQGDGYMTAAIGATLFGLTAGLLAWLGWLFLRGLLRR